MTEDRPELACGDCREHLHAYLDGELSEAEADAIARHLERCAECFERSEIEQAFRHAIRERAGASRSASPALQERISRALDAEDERRSQIELAGGTVTRSERGGPAWRGWSVRLLVAAATVLVAAATWSTLTVPRVDGGEPTASVQHPAFVKGQLVCLDCVMMKAELPATGLRTHLDEATIPSPDPSEHHRLHLRCDKGRLWELYPEPASAGLLDEHDNAGRSATVVGTAYPEIGVLRVARLELE